MKKMTNRKDLASGAGACVLLLFALAALLWFPRDVRAADANKLQAVGTPTVHVVTGGTADMEIKLKNTTSETVDYINVWDASAEGEGEDAFCPYTFQAKRKSPEPENAKVTYYSDGNVYGIEPGQTATFHIYVQAYDLDPGTYNHYIQFADFWWEYDYNEYGWPIAGTGRKILGEMYSAKIPVKMIVYNPPGAALTAGTSSNVGFDVTQFPASGIDLGTINLAGTSQDALTKKQEFFIKNTSAVVDTYINARPDITLRDGTGFAGPSGDVYEDPAPFSYYNGYGLWSYDTTLSPDAAHQVSVSADATNFIAGTYQGTVLIDTVPHKIKLNGAEGNNTGSYTIPVKVKFTGINPRLPARATNMKAAPGNGMAELRWSSPDTDVNYYVYRREGVELKTDPDLWTESDWAKYEKLNFNWISAKDDGTYLYVDGTAENDKTYTYIVTAGGPFTGYASAPVSVTPGSGYISRILTPDSFSVHDETGCVKMSWFMNEQYGGRNCDGAGMVDHFNIYRDGVLVKQVCQSAVMDETTQGWIDDGDGNSHYGITGHSYSWETSLEVPVTGQTYSFAVACVAPNGTEGYLSEEIPGMSLPETAQITGHSVYYDRYYYDETTGRDVPALVISMKTLENGDSVESLTFWRAAGTASPDTSTEPYAKCEKNYTYGSGQFDFADTRIKSGNVYTYTVQALDYDGNQSGFYTFTAAAAEKVDFSTTDVTWDASGGRKAVLSWNSDYYYDDEGDLHYTGTYKVYRNGALLKTLSAAASGKNSYENDPGKDGTYVYRVDKQYKVGSTTYTIPGKEFIFVRNTAPVDESIFIRPPAAPELSVRIADGYPILSWTPQEGGGEPEGYHIYRIDGGEQKLGGRYVYSWKWYGYDKDWTLWGNGRYLTIQDGQTRSFADGYSGNYRGDETLGRTESIGWEEDQCPHVYWITAYNSAGESGRSGVFTFGYAGEDEYGNAIRPVSPSEEEPAAPVITNMWADWNDRSQGSSEWDQDPDGYVRVAWSDASSGGDIDRWNIHVDGTHTNWTNDFSETIAYADVLHDSSLRQGGKELQRGYIVARTGENGDLDRTVTATVAAQNSTGETISEEKSLVIRSFPRSRVTAGSGSVKVEWTDLTDDTETIVTGWEIRRKAEHDIWRVVRSCSAGEAVYASEDKHGVQGYSWTDTDVTNGKTYQYRIIAKCADGIDRAGVVREAVPEKTATFETPGAPVNLNARVVNGEVLFEWDAPVTGGAAKYYQVMYESQESYETEPSWKTAGGTTAPSTTAVWAPDTAGTYRWFVYAYNYINGNLVPEGANIWETDDIDLLYPSHSEIAEVTITASQIAQQASGYPAKPVLSAEAGEGQITLRWTLEESGAAPTCFEIIRVLSSGNDPAFGTVIMPAAGNSWTYIDDTADPGVRYCYRVVSKTASGSTGIYSEVYARAEGKTKDEDAAEQVSALIDTLPQPEELTADNIGGWQELITEVKGIYDGLTSKQKRFIDEAHTEKLLSCVDLLEFVRLSEQYGSVVAPVRAAIQALPDADAVTLDNGEEIAAARSAYNRLPADAKKLLRAELEKLEAVEAVITDLKYNLQYGAVSAEGSYMIGGEERPLIAVTLNGEILEEGRDYYISGYAADGSDEITAAPEAAGWYRAVITGITPYSGRVISTEVFPVHDGSHDLSEAIVTGENVFTYSGSPFIPQPAVEAGGTLLQRGADYEFSEFEMLTEGSLDEWTVISPNDVKNAGVYRVRIVPAEGTLYFGETSFDFTIEPRNISGDEISAGIIDDGASGGTVYPYTGEAIRPGITVCFGNDVLVEGTDYTLTYFGDTAVGEGLVGVEGCGNFFGERGVPFVITEPEADNASENAYEELIASLRQEIEDASQSGDEDAAAAAEQALASALDLSDPDSTEIVIAPYTYTGSEILPAVILKKTFGGVIYELGPGTYFAVEKAEGADNRNTGTGAVSVRPNTGDGESFMVPFEILPAVLTASYAGETIGAGQQPALRVDVTGFVGDDTPENPGADYEAPAVTAPETEQGGKYTLMPSGGSARNYIFIYRPGVLSVNAVSLEDAEILGIHDVIFNGQEQTLALTVALPADGGTVLLTEGTDYTVEYHNHTAVGKAEVMITGTGSYSGSVRMDFRIQFKDVADKSVFYYDNLYWASDLGIVTGWDDGTFRPMNISNRAAVVTFLWRLAGKPDVEATTVFPDMTSNEDFNKAITWAVQQGITTGFSDGTFRPWDQCNRAAIMTFIWRYAGRPAPRGRAKFKDMTGNADFDNAISWAVENGITTGWDDNTFRPWNKCTRLAVVSFLGRYAAL